MPLPKRPAKRGDVLTDYGPEADLTKPAGKAAPKAAAKPSQAPETASKPRRTTRKTREGRARQNDEDCRKDRHRAGDCRPQIDGEDAREARREEAPQSKKPQPQ